MVLVMGFTAAGRLASKLPHGISNAFIVYLTCSHLSHISKFRIYIHEWSKQPALGLIGSVDGTIQGIWCRGDTVCSATSARRGRSGTGHAMVEDPVVDIIKYNTVEGPRVGRTSVTIKLQKECANYRLSVVFCI